MPYDLFGAFHSYEIPACVCPNCRSELFPVGDARVCLNEVCPERNVPRESSIFFFDYLEEPLDSGGFILDRTGY